MFRNLEAKMRIDFEVEQNDQVTSSSYVMKYLSDTENLRTNQMVYFDNDM